MSREDVLSTCEILFSPGQVVEIRALADSGTFSGYYNDFEKLSADVEALDSTPQFKGIYFTLNPVNPDLLARKVNRISRSVKNEPATDDLNIVRRVWFPIDIDPTRPSGISSSNAEHGEALVKAAKIKGFLSEMGWPDPILSDSGNGAHLLYRIHLPNDKESTELVKDCLTTLSQFFTDENSSVDIANHNASRIWKMYGTVSRKGDHTEDRPHRRSEILECPDEIKPVLGSDLMLLASLKKEDESKKSGNHPTGGNSGTSSIDLGEWLTTHGLGYEEKDYSGGRLFILDECPFSGAHKDGAYAIQFASGAIFAGCHHNSCGGGEQRWSELRAMHEGESERAKRASRMTSEEFDQKKKQDAREKAQAKNEYYGNSSEIPNSSDHIDDANKKVDYTAEAARVLREGNPVEYILDSFKADHEGDEVVARCLIMSFASRSVINSNGLHVLVTGDSGKGKSHAFDTMILHLPPDYRLDGRLSDKALFYAEDIRAGSAICLDDVGLSEQMQETLKGVTTSFKKPFKYRTVNKDRKGQTCIIPERCVWWVAKMEGTGDDQVWNRMLTCWIDDSTEQDDKVLVRELEAACALPLETEVVRDELVVCQHIWEQLLPAHVVIPYSKRIRFSSSANRRNPGMLLDLVKSIAILHQYQREKIELKNGTVVIATVEDFKAACSIYKALNGESGGQMSKLTRSEAELIQVIVKSGKREFTMKELQELADKSYNAVRKLLNGGASHQSHYSGLLEKCPAISFLDRTDTTDGGDTSRRQKVFTWDHERYIAWSSGGGCWLDHEGEDDDIGGSGGSGRLGGGNEPPVNEPHTTDDSQNNNNNKNIFYNRRKDEKVQSVNEPSPTYVSAPENFRHSAGQDQPAQPASSPSADLKKTAEPIGGNEPPVTASNPALPPVPRISLSDIDPDDYESVDGVWSGPCAVCGGKWVQYTEKVSAKLKAEKRFTTRKICEKCREKAKKAISKSFTVLPGTVDLAEMEHVTGPRGRCSVCHQGEVKWYDRAGQLGLCDICHSREQSRIGGMA